MSVIAGISSFMTSRLAAWYRNVKQLVESAEINLAEGRVNEFFLRSIETPIDNATSSLYSLTREIVRTVTER
jgi:hypothetical protein